MKILSTTFATIFLIVLFARHAGAQSESPRTRIELSITADGKTIVAELNGISTSINRSLDEALSLTIAKDSAKKETPAYRSGSGYISLDVKRMPDELLRFLSKKQGRFDGTITIVDTYGKLPTRTIRFKRANMVGFAEQFSSAAYSEGYGSSSMSIGFQELSINGITIEL